MILLLRDVLPADVSRGIPVVRVNPEDRDAYRAVLEDLERGWARLALPLRQLWHVWRRNSRSGSRRNIAFHYDLGNPFYAAWLDASMQYSSALYATGALELQGVPQKLLIITPSSMLNMLNSMLTLPITRCTNTPPAPCTAYAPALSSGSPVAMYQSIGFMHWDSDVMFDA